MTQRIEEYVGRKVIVEPECLKDSPISGTYRIELTDEEIIRCRDCKNARRTIDGKVKWCAVDHDEDEFYLNVIDDGFCAWAERSE